MIELLLSTATSLYVYDGDTLRVNNIPYRLVGIDTPEIHSKCEAEHRLAIIARDHLRALVREPSARLIEVLCYGSNFGRKCAIVKVKDQNIAPLMVKARLGDAYYCSAAGCPPRRQWCTK